MAALASILAKSVVFLFVTGNDFPIGTGFVVGYPLPGKEDRYVPIIVTAKHVIANHDQITARFSPKSGAKPVTIPYDLQDLRKSGDFWEHADMGVDIVAFRTKHFGAADYEMIPLGAIASKKILEEEDLKPTDEVWFPSLLVNFMGTERNYPVIRSGSVAQIPEETVPLRYKVGEQEIETEQNLILVDAIAPPGASGSPVFLSNAFRVKEGKPTWGGKVWLIGLIHGFYPALPRELTKVEVSKALPTFQENSGIAIVFPAWRLREILESDSVRRRMEEILKIGERARQALPDPAAENPTRPPELR